MPMVIVTTYIVLAIQMFAYLLSGEWEWTDKTNGAQTSLMSSLRMTVHPPNFSFSSSWMQSGGRASGCVVSSTTACWTRVHSVWVESRIWRTSVDVERLLSGQVVLLLPKLSLIMPSVTCVRAIACDECAGHELVAAIRRCFLDLQILTTAEVIKRQTVTSCAISSPLLYEFVAFRRCDVSSNKTRTFHYRKYQKDTPLGTWSDA